MCWASRQARLITGARGISTTWEPETPDTGVGTQLVVRLADTAAAGTCPTRCGVAGLSARPAPTQTAKHAATVTARRVGMRTQPDNDQLPATAQSSFRLLVTVHLDRNST